MTTFLRLRGWATALAVSAGLLAVTGAAHAQQASITGRITDAGTGQGLTSARVLVTGTAYSTNSGPDGRFTIRPVNQGTYEVRVVLVGYESQKKTVTVAAGQAATVDFALVASPFQLEEIVTTATGEQRKVEVGNATATIKAAEVVETAQPQNLASLLQGRAAGVSIMQGSGTVGTGTRIRIRGVNSINLSNEPIIIVDGIRTDNSSSTSPFGSGLGTGGQQVSRLNDINPDDIENIEVVKGPSAATLYGPAAANGVVVVTTKKGKGGKTKWNFYTEQGRANDRGNYPDNWLWTRTTNGQVSAANPRCRLQDIAQGVCTESAAIKTTDNPLLSEETPFAPGWRMQYGANVAGGTESLNYFISGEFENEDGVFSMPAPEEARLLRQSGRTELRGDEITPSRQRRVNVRSNVTAQLSSTTQVQVNAGYLYGRLRLPVNDNSVLGTITSGYAGTGRRIVQTGTEAQFYPDGRPGWNTGFTNPGDAFQNLNDQDNERITGNATVTSRPLKWLNARALIGVDFVNLSERQNQRFNEGPNFADRRLGLNTLTEFRTYNYTAEGSATGTFQLTDGLVSKTTAGAQYLRGLAYFTQGSATQLGFGANVLRTGALAPTVSEGTNENATWGYFVEEQLSWKDRLFLTGALRRDQNSAYGGQFGAVTTPKASISYLLSEEGWFPRGDFLSNVRVRGAYGQSSLTPGVTTALAFFGTVTAVTPEGVGAGVNLSNFANSQLKPEVSTEYEGGIDLGLFKNRVNVEATYFYKKTTDALIARTLPASIGVPTTYTENIGSIRNKGFEWVVNAQILNGRDVAWDLGFSGSMTRNNVLSLGGVPPIIFNDPQQRHQEGYIAGSYWERKITGWQDGVNVGANSPIASWRSFCTAAAATQAIKADGIIAGCEVVVDTGFTETGSSFPLNEFAFNTGVSLLNNMFRVQALFDYRGNYRMANLTESFRCTSSQNCRELYDNTAPEAERLGLAARFFHPSATRYAYQEDGSFLRFRELAVTFNAPRDWARAITADRISVTLAGRNLGLWTDYTGVDPEVNGQGNANFSQRDFMTQPPVRYFTMRFNVGF